jgi:putative Ca2+/H+ antiporter (TMEM165/GDT1 family)
MRAARLFIAQFGDRSHVLIAALAATSGAGLWAAAGGMIGWVLAMLPFLAFGTEMAARRPVRLLRPFAAAILALWGVRAGLGAFGLIG